MSGSTSTAGGNTTVTFSWTAPTARVQATADDAAQALYNRGLGYQTKAYSAFSNQEKLNLLDAYLLRVLVDLAKAQHIDNAASTASATAATENTIRFI